MTNKTGNQQLTQPHDVMGFAQRKGLDLTISSESQLNQVAAHINSANQHYVYAGVYLINLKESLEKGQYYKSLESIGISQEKARSITQTTKFIMSLPEAEQNKMLAVSRSKVLEFAKADPEVIEDIMADGGESENIAHLSVRELRLALQKEKNANVNLETKNDELSSTLKFKTASVDTDGGEFSREVDEAQVFAAQYFKQVDIAVSQLDVLRAAHNERAYANNEVGKIERKKIARALYRSAAGMASLVVNLVSQLEDENYDDVKDPYATTEILSEEQQEMFINAAKLLVEDQEAVNRKINYQIDANRPAGKGRPKKY